MLTQSKEPSLEESYCSSAANHASQSLFAWQAERLNALRAELDERIRELEAKKAAYEQWQSRHREQQEKFNANFVAIISRMRPDAAAAQLSNMEEVAAAQIITRLDPRIASTILNEMSPPKAARLADNMTGGPAPAQKR
ncbi:MAG: MotE family protein [Beijerinckiaceae bacterium]